MYFQIIYIYITILTIELKAICLATYMVCFIWRRCHYAQHISKLMRQSNRWPLFHRVPRLPVVKTGDRDGSTALTSS